MTTHQFTPNQYHNTLGWHKPALQVASGDTVVTTTIDARGADINRDVVGERPNPMTGPFYVAGAEPGDTLVVQLDKIMPNRSYGWTGRMIAPNIVDPAYTAELPWPADESERYAHWHVDMDEGSVRLVEPKTRLGDFTIPTAPMVGCFGVAPKGGQAISTATSAEHGGNMDYRGFVAGVTVYFPIFAPGALFYLGDCHAVQGDGEIVGNGVEISCDVQFTLTLLKEKEIFWPRGENESYIFTVGNARPLDQATQHATTEMVQWLQEDYALDAVGAHLLMGQCVEYDLGNIFDPAYTMVCKIPKRVLQTFKSI